MQNVEWSALLPGYHSTEQNSVYFNLSSLAWNTILAILRQLSGVRGTETEREKNRSKWKYILPADCRR